MNSLGLVTWKIWWNWRHARRTNV